MLSLSITELCSHIQKRQSFILIFLKHMYSTMRKATIYWNNTQHLVFQRKLMWNPQIWPLFLMLCKMAWFLFEANSLFLICVACVKTIFCVNVRKHPDLNQRPPDLQSNALPLSYVPTFHKNKSPSRFFETHVGWAKELVTETRRIMSCSMDSWCSADESSITDICHFV